MIEQVAGVAAAETAEALSLPAARTNGADFGQWLAQQIGLLNQQVTSADMEVRRLALGEAGNIHEVMMRLEAAKLSFELAVQVRNRVLEAYQEILRMQI